MKRDYFTLELADVDDAENQPAIHITYEGPDGLGADDVTTDGGVDVAFRYRTPVDDPEASGVFGVTDRLTGDFILEVNADANTVERLVSAARDYGETAPDADGWYRVVLAEDGETFFETAKRTLLVYDEGGDLRRKHSLIPSGVEL
ncbi:MAG: DUF5793 family protein [Halorientalis sp.]